MIYWAPFGCATPVPQGVWAQLVPGWWVMRPAEISEHTQDCYIPNPQAGESRMRLVCPEPGFKPGSIGQSHHTIIGWLRVFVHGLAFRNGRSSASVTDWMARKSPDLSKFVLSASGRSTRWEHCTSIQWLHLNDHLTVSRQAGRQLAYIHRADARQGIFSRCERTNPQAMDGLSLREQTICRARFINSPCATHGWVKFARRDEMSGLFHQLSLCDCQVPMAKSLATGFRQLLAALTMGQNACTFLGQTEAAAPVLMASSTNPLNGSRSSAFLTTELSFC